MCPASSFNISHKSWRSVLQFLHIRHNEHLIYKTVMDSVLLQWNQADIIKNIICNLFHIYILENDGCCRIISAATSTVPCTSVFSHVSIVMGPICTKKMQIVQEILYFHGDTLIIYPAVLLSFPLLLFFSKLQGFFWLLLSLVKIKTYVIDAGLSGIFKK